MSDQAMKCRKCNTQLMNLGDHICPKGGVHEMNKEAFWAWKSHYADKYLETLRLKEDVTEDESKLHARAYLHENFDDKMMAGVEEVYDLEKEFFVKRGAIHRSGESQQAKEIEIKKLPGYDIHFTRLIPSSFIHKLDDDREMVNTEDFAKMIGHISKSLLYEKLVEIQYRFDLNAYIVKITGVDLHSNTERMGDLVETALSNRVKTIVKNSDDIRIEHIMSTVQMKRVISEDLIEVVLAEYPDSRKVYDENLHKFVEEMKHGYRCFNNIIRYFMGVWMLRTYNMETYAKFDRRDTDFLEGMPHYGRYIGETMQYHQPFNLCYKFNFPTIIYRYQYSITSNEGLDEGVQHIMRKGKVYEVYDFLQLYKNIEMTQVIKWIVHKKETVRVRTNIDISQVVIDEHPEHFSVYFNGEKVAEEQGNYSHCDCSASFDLNNSKCYLTGTTDQIDWMVRYFNSYKYNLHKPVFNTFKGSMSVVSKAIYSKRVFQALLRYKRFADYWHTKSNTPTNNNFLFIFGTKEPKSTTTEYVQLNITQTSKINVMDNEWKFSFEGNRHDYLLPFISMLLAMIHFTSNISYNRKFADYADAERNLLHFYTDKTGRNNPRKSTDSSLMSVALHVITKKDVYSSSVADALTDEKEINAYSGRSKPFFIHYFPTSDSVTCGRWNDFFIRAAKKENKMLIKRESPQWFVRDSRIRFVGDAIIMIVKTHTYRIGARYKPANSIHEYYITYYPEKSNVYAIEDHNGIWIRRSAISENHRSSSSITHGIRLLDSIPASTETAVKNFTSEPIKKISFFEPYKLREDETPLQHLMERYKSREAIISLCKQQLWDHTEDEIIDSINTFDMKKHHELIQDYLQSIVLYFEFDHAHRKYDLAFPRHKYWYSFNYNYKEVTFVLLSQNEMYEVVHFEDKQTLKKSVRRTLPIDMLLSPNPLHKYIKTFDITSTTGYIKRQDDLGEIVGDVEDKPVQNTNTCTRCPEITSELLKDDFPDWDVRGQMFDGNGKSIGVRLVKGNKIADIRYLPQFTIMSNVPRETRNYGIVKDSMTNIQPSEIDLPHYYKLIERKTRQVRYNIADLNDEYERRRKMLYYISRMIITHWLMGKTEDTVETPDLEEYLELMIQPIDQELVEDQYIDRIVVPKYFAPSEDRSAFESYLENIMPNHFHDGAFRVREEDVEQLRVYMKRELDVLVNMDHDFFVAFSNARMHTVLSTRDKNEIIDIRNIQELQTMHNIKKYLVDQRNYLFSSQFMTDFDIKSRTIKDNAKTVVSDKVVISKNTMSKTELLITKINNTYYMIRFTDNGTVETAVYICHMWEKHRKLCSFWETESMVGTKRIFIVEEAEDSMSREIRQDRIVELNTNNDADIIVSGQDYHILQYRRNNGIVFAAMLPLKDTA